MFFRRKAVGGRTYLQIVESRRDGSSIRQHVVATLGRTEDWLDGGKLDQLLQSGARLTETALVLSALRDGDALLVDSRRIGPSLIFARLWRETGCQAVVEGLLAERQFQFPVERAIFASVLHRLCISGSDRAGDKWLEGYRIAGLDGIDLHHLYRAIAWLGEELADQEGRTRAPRAIKDLVEERLFARRRDLFNDLDLVFFDTSALYFHGEGGETLGRRGKSKDHRPELKQVVIGVVLDRHGRPLCSETWPGNATDVQALLPVIDRLRARFCIGRICVVADRGMISARTLAELEARGIEYILGTRERNDAEVRATVLADTTGMVPLSIPKAAGTTTEIEVKEVLVRPWDGKASPGAMWSATPPSVPPGRPPSGPRSSRRCRNSCRAATNLWSATAASASSCRWSAATTSRWMRRRCPRRQSSTASTCCAPTASCPPSRWRSATASCGRWSRSSAPPRPCSKRGRSITPVTPLSAATCSPPSWRWCCARNCRTGCRRLNWISSGRNVAGGKPDESLVAPAHQASQAKRMLPWLCEYVHMNIATYKMVYVSNLQGILPCS